MVIFGVKRAKTKVNSTEGHYIHIIRSSY